MKLLICYGTRPEWVKIKPLLDKLKESEVQYDVLFTGQQEDLAGFQYDKRLKIQPSSNRLDAIVTACMNDEWVFHQADCVLVQGDTSSALGIALAAFHRQKQIIHLEAGLRTYQKNPYPEEMNRVLIDKLADVHLCPTQQNRQNLLSEGHSGDTIFVTGNTGLDATIPYDVKYEPFVLVTMHRRENHERMKEWFEQINHLAKTHSYLTFILPIHPNPNVKKHRDILTDVKAISPLPYEEMIRYIARCRLLITDSGGLQEEASWYNKKAIVCRDCTERPEVLGVHSFLCETPERLASVFLAHINEPVPSKHYCPYGDGKASERIIEILKNIQ